GMPLAGGGAKMPTLESAQPMNWLDSTIVAILGLGALLGAWSGLLRQMTRLVGFGVALVAAIYFHESASARISQQVLQDADPRVTSTIAYIFVFLTIYLGIFIVSLFLEHCVTAIQLQTVNRLLGAVLGLVKVALILGVIFLGVSSYP